MAAMILEHVERFTTEGEARFSVHPSISFFQLQDGNDDRGRVFIMKPGNTAIVNSCKADSSG